MTLEEDLEWIELTANIEERVSMVWAMVKEEPGVGKQNNQIR